MIYSVKIQRLKNEKDMEIAYEHNVDRDSLQTDKAKNIVVFNRGIDYNSFFLKRIHEPPFNFGLGEKTIRNNAVWALDITIEMGYGSKGNAFNDIENFVFHSDFILTKVFGEDNIAGINLHLEPLPHIHAVVVPITKDGRLSAYEMLKKINRKLYLKDEIIKEIQPSGLNLSPEKRIRFQITPKK